MTYVRVVCPKPRCGETSWVERTDEARCLKCKARLTPPDNRPRNVQFTDQTRQLLTAPFGRRAAGGMSRAKDVDRSLKSIQAKYKHFPGIY